MSLRQLIGSLRTEEQTPAGVLVGEARPVWPYVTISRQAGSGGVQFGRLLAQRLNDLIVSEHPWQCFDRELVERIASDHHLSTELVESLENSSHTWIAEFLQGLSRTDHSPSELAVFRRVVETVRALARAGNVVLVGFGGALMTRDMPRGLRVRIIAPLEWRINNLARNEGLNHDAACQKVKLLDRDRDAYIARFWPHLRNMPEVFHLTLNASLLSEEQMVECVLPLVGMGRG